MGGALEAQSLGGALEAWSLGGALEARSLGGRSGSADTWGRSGSAGTGLLTLGGLDTLTAGGQGRAAVDELVPTRARTLPRHR